MTTRVFPRAERPAVKAKGTVRPSLSPMVASDTVRGEICGTQEGVDRVSAKDEGKASVRALEGENVSLVGVDSYEKSEDDAALSRSIHWSSQTFGISFIRPSFYSP
jgi:hypothetical protein